MWFIKANSKLNCFLSGAKKKKKKKRKKEEEEEDISSERSRQCRGRTVFIWNQHPVTIKCMARREES
jgi:hypothetical protein